MGLRNALATLIVATLPGAALAENILTVLGADGGELGGFTLETLDALEQSAYETDNAFVDAPSEFSGPLIRTVMADLGIDAAGYSEVRLTAINEYAVNVPISDVVDYDVMLATRRDGDEMSVRDKGPIWIMYPISQHDELQDSIYSSRLIWQLESLQFIE